MRSIPGQGNAGDMTEDNHSHPVIVHPPAAYEPDLNSNCPPESATTTTTDPVTTSRLSNASSNDGGEATDYQWLAEVGYKERRNRRGPGRRHPRSIFAALGSPGGDFTYEDLSRNIDVNLAEIDMEDFRSEDINSILALPAMYCGDFQRSQNRGEQAASLSGSLMAAAFESSSSTAATSCCCATSGDSADMSVCKSEPLFSPLRDAAGLPGGFSVDSLDCDSYDEHELMLTCRANMNNYTIAFEGSFARCSDDSDYHEAAGSQSTDSESWSGQLKSRDSGSLARSDCALTTWSKLKRVGSETGPEDPAAAQSPVAACKSRSLPNLCRKAAESLEINTCSIGPLDLSGSEQCVPVYDVHSSCGQSDAGSQQSSVSLMRLFMQRTGSGHSIAHSLSSGALRHMDAEDSADERLRCVLDGQLDDSVADEEGRTTVPATPVGPHQVHGVAKNAAKARRATSGNCCKLFGADGVHEEGPARVGSPLASPIQEEDEGEEAFSGQTVSTRYCDGLADMAISDSMDGSASQLPGRRPVRDRTTGTQTKPSAQPDRVGSPYWRSKSSNDGVARERNDASSSSSGYKSIRNSGTEHPRRAGGVIAGVRSRGTQIPVHVSDEAIQTSFKGEWLQKVLANCARMRVRDHVVQVSSGRPMEEKEENGGPEADDKKAVYVCYPNYSLPDLAFLRSPDNRKTVSKMVLVPTKPVLSPCSEQHSAAQYSNTRESLRRVDLSHIQDWDSLNVLLPQAVRDMLAEIRARSGPEADVTEPQTAEEAPKKEGPGPPDGGIQVPMTLQSLASRTELNGPGPRHRRPPPLPKRSISLPQGESGPRQVAAKPPLPKGILRRSSVERQRQSPQRYSMSDFLALQQQQERHLNRHGQLPVAEPCDCLFAARNLARDLRTVDRCPMNAELAGMLGMSGCNCEAVADDAAAAPQPDSCPCCEPADAEAEDCQQSQDAKNKKTVSFSSGLLPKCEPCPHQEQRGSHACETDGDRKEWPSSVSEDGDCCAPQEFCVSPLKESDCVQAPTLQEANVNSSFWDRKRDLVAAVLDAVNILNAHFGKAKDPHCKFIIGSCLQTPLTGHKVLHHLCPALFAVLSDGLRHEVYNLFGHVGNSVWMVVEAVAQSGHCTKQMSDLVVHVNNEQGLWEKHMKFNAFVFGLLNIRSLDTWLSLLGTCGSVLHKHYAPSAFLHAAGAATKPLFDNLLLSAQTLSLLPFDLDLALEAHLGGGRPETQSGCDYNHNCLLHGDVACCHSWLAAALSKSVPTAGNASSPRSSPVARRSRCQPNDGSPSSPRTPDRSLRRGYSQDSAIASETSGDVPRPLGTRSPQRPRSCAEYGSGRWSPVPLDKRLSCGDAGSGALFGAADRPKSNWSPRCDKARDATEGNKKPPEARDLLITDMMGPGPEAKAQRKKLEEELYEDGARQYAEKGALDATIAEGRDSQNNIKDAEEEDSAKFKELQLRWEILSCAASPKRAVSANARSKIPRLVTPPLRSGGRMDDSVVSVRTSASSPDSGCNDKGLAMEAEEPAAVATKAKTRLNPEPGRNRPAPKAPVGQPTLVVKTSADRSPVVRKRTSPRRVVPGGPTATPQAKHRQSVSRGVGGPEKDN